MCRRRVLGRAAECTPFSWQGRLSLCMHSCGGLAAWPSRQDDLAGTLPSRARSAWYRGSPAIPKHEFKECAPNVLPGLPKSKQHKGATVRISSRSDIRRSRPARRLWHTCPVHGRKNLKTKDSWEELAPSLHTFESRPRQRLARHHRVPRMRTQASVICTGARVRHPIGKHRSASTFNLLKCTSICSGACEWRKHAGRPECLLSARAFRLM